MFWPAATSSTSAFTLRKVLKRNFRIPCHSFASANRGSIQTFRFRKAFS
jgi:hypothetical protein